MRPLVRQKAPLVLLALLLVCWWCRGVRPALHAQAGTQARAQAAQAAPLEWQGVASCSTGPCHEKGGAGKRFNEVTFWKQDKKHAETYLATLFSEKSKQIVKNWKQSKTLAEAKPEKEPLCLYCHSMDRAQRRRPKRFSLDEGVGCELCHGPAEKWIDAHQRTQTWSKLSDAQKADRGFRPLKDLQTRTNTCVECHVGSPAANVNHDLIAAGHPRLIFEQAAYHANMPKHWEIKDDLKRHPDLEVRLWLLGQAASASAAADLLEARAKDPKQPWPEFAEFDCFACHHELREPSWRRERGFGGRPPGSLSWGSWYFAMPRVLAGGGPGAPARDFARDLDHLAKTMSLNLLKRDAVAAPAAAVGKHLKLWQQELGKAKPLDATAARGLMKTLIDAGPEAARVDWEGAVQLYLAVAGVNETLGNLDRGHAVAEWKMDLQKLFKELDVQTRYNSPRGYHPRPIENRINDLAKRLGPTPASKPK